MNSYLQSAIKRLSRSAIDPIAWDQCVSTAPNRIIYGHTWYLDAVTHLPGWRWDGLVLTGQGNTYEAVMPVPLRRKYGVWVVHQPLFCQFLDVFGQDLTPDILHAFAETLLTNYRYGSILHLQQPTFNDHNIDSKCCHTHLLDLSVNYEALYRQYAPEVRRHLRLAQAVGWTIEKSTDTGPLLSLFRQHHAPQVSGGIGEWAYALFTHLFEVLVSQRAAILLYARLDGRIEVGAVFVQYADRIVYLFNAATPTGRKHHARTLLIDRVIQEQTGQAGLLFDFESPEEQSIAHFYKQFGAVPSPYWAVRWNRLPTVINWLQQCRLQVMESVGLTKTGVPASDRRTA